jgi:hypothetical protein
MKIKCILTGDTETGEYEIQFNNLSAPGENMDYNFLMIFLKTIFKDVDNQVADLGVNSSSNIIKEYH